MSLISAITVHGVNIFFYYSLIFSVKLVNVAVQRMDRLLLLVKLNILVERQCVQFGSGFIVRLNCFGMNSKKNEKYNRHYGGAGN